MEDLALNKLEELTVHEAHEKFKVTDLESANWCFRKLSNLEKQKREYESLAHKEIDRIMDWLTKEKEKIEDQEEFFKCLLTEYACHERQNNPKFKLSTPYGKLGFRKQQPKYIYQDEEIIKWATTNGKLAFVRIKEEVNKEALKESITVSGTNAVTEDGEIIPGVQIIPQEDSIRIEVAE